MGVETLPSLNFSFVKYKLAICVAAYFGVYERPPDERSANLSFPGVVVSLGESDRLGPPVRCHVGQ